VAHHLSLLQEMAPREGTWERVNHYEKLCASGEAFVYAAMRRIMARRLARTCDLFIQSQKEYSPKFASPRSTTYERPRLRSAAFGHYHDFPDFLIIPIGGCGLSVVSWAHRTKA
jgi:hypothetical protein